LGKGEYHANLVIYSPCVHSLWRGEEVAGQIVTPWANCIDKRAIAQFAVFVFAILPNRKQRAQSPLLRSDFSCARGYPVRCAPRPGAPKRPWPRRTSPPKPRTRG